MDLILARDVELDHAQPLDMVPNYKELTPFKMAAKEGNVVVRGGVGGTDGSQKDQKTTQKKQKTEIKTTFKQPKVFFDNICYE